MVGVTARENQLDGGDDVQAVALAPGGPAVALAGIADDCSSPALLAKMAQVKPGWAPTTQPAKLYLSGDSGGSWHQSGVLPFPMSAYQEGELAISSSLIAAMDSCADLELNADHGQHWSKIVFETSSTGCTVSLYEREIWLYCPGSVAHSTDEGRSWTSFVTNIGGVQQLSQQLDPIGPGSAIVSAGGSLWRTTDGGAHWSQIWPVLAGES
jgi:hypothetical protein